MDPHKEGRDLAVQLARLSASHAAVAAYGLQTEVLPA